MYQGMHTQTWFMWRWDRMRRNAQNAQRERTSTFQLAKAWPLGVLWVLDIYNKAGVLYCGLSCFLAPTNCSLSQPAPFPTHSPVSRSSSEFGFAAGSVSFYILGLSWGSPFSFLPTHGLLVLRRTRRQPPPPTPPPRTPRQQQLHLGVLLFLAEAGGSAAALRGGGPQKARLDNLARSDSF